MKLVLKVLLKVLLIPILLVFVVASVFYVETTVYDFPEEKPFSGDHFYNPYADLPKHVLRANFHAHSIAWEGVTNGHNTEKDIFDAYQEQGYDIACISNYHRISTYAKDKNTIYIPNYEHGYNVLKSHYLGLNCKEPSKFDFPLYQTSSHQQEILNRIKEKGGTPIMAHPKFGGGRRFNNMRDLVGYNFVEVLNHYRVSDAYWDQGLSAGRLTWIIGDDDTHDLIEEPTFRYWTMIYANEKNKEEVMKEMRMGRTYGVMSKNRIWDNRLGGIQVSKAGDYKLQMTEVADSIVLFGQEGKILKRASSTKGIEYQFDLEDTYVRAVAYNANSTVFTNPVIRFDGKKVPLNEYNEAEVNRFLTALCILLFTFCGLIGAIGIRKVILW